MSQSFALLPDKFTSFRRRLLRWFRRYQREFPWRNTRDPYSIWVSEIMLQQTQAATVVPIFQRFLQQFPTIHALADADIQHVQRAWEGLGYYRRARHLHLAAQKMVAERDGQFPKNPEELLSYHGFGRYTVGAVLSRAFEMRLPILETNSERVLCRIIGLDRDPKKTESRNRLWEWAEKLLPSRNVGDFNQAMMELGALLCTPNNPQCSTCPVSEFCQAKNQGRQTEIPIRGKQVTIREIDEAAVVVRKGQRVLLAKRPSRGRWAGLWEFPHLPVHQSESWEDAVARCVKQLTGLSTVLKSELTTIRHSIMNERIRMVCWEARYQSGKLHSDFYVDYKWLEVSDFERYPQCSPQRRLSRLVSGNQQGRLF